jgi:hypothetical protein
MKNFKRNIYRLSGSECDFTGVAEEVVDRSVAKTKNVLILSDPNSVQLYDQEGQAIPDPYVSDVPLNNISTTIANKETALGMIPTTMLSYAEFEALTDAQISQYAHIWDIGYDTLITSAVGNKYLTYLSNGGAIFLLGENSLFIQRDETLVNIIDLAGGGTVTTSNAALAVETASVEAEFRLQNQTPTVQFNAPGSFSNIGAGTILSQSSSGVHAAVWKTGSLSGHPTGAIVSVLDINFLVGASVQPDFINNLSIILNVS